MIYNFVKKEFRSLFISKFFFNKLKQITVCTKIFVAPKICNFTEDVFWTFFLIFFIWPVTNKKQFYLKYTNNFKGIRFFFLNKHLSALLNQSFFILPHAFSISNIFYSSQVLQYQLQNFSNYPMTTLSLQDESLSLLNFYMVFFFKSSSFSRSSFLLNYFRIPVLK